MLFRSANPEVNMHDYAVRLTQLLMENYKQESTNLDDLRTLLASPAPFGDHEARRG